MSRYMAIPFPEELDPYTWMEKKVQLDWLLDSGHLPVRRKTDTDG